MMRSTLPLLMVLCLLPWSCSRGCQGSEEPELVDDATSPIPDDTAERSRLLARHMPLGAHALLVVKSFADLSNGFSAIKERIRNIFDLGAVESEIRNTFGVDLARRVSFREVGIAYDAGFSVAVVQQQLVLSVYLLDPAPFLERAQLVLRRQPFNLRAPVQTEELGTFHIELYSRRTSQPPEIAVLTSGVVGMVVVRMTSNGQSVADIARSLAQVTPDTSVASNTDFDRQLAFFDDFPFFLFIDAVAASTFYQEQLAEQLGTVEAFALSQFNASVLSLGAGLRLEENRIPFRGYLSVTDDVAQTARGIDVPRGEPVDLTRFLSPTTIIAVRAGIDPTIAWNTILRFQGERGAELLRRHLARSEASFGATIEGDLTQILTGRIALTINRISLLSLLQGVRFTDWADALNLVFVAQLADQARAVEILDRLAASDSSPYQRIQEQPIARYTCRRADSCYGQILVGQGFLAITADRVSRWVMTRLEQPAEASPESMSPVARELMERPSATGIFVDFTRLVPLATILNYPQVVRDFLGFLDNLVVEVETSGDGLLVNGQLLLTTAE